LKTKDEACRQLKFPLPLNSLGDTVANVRSHAATFAAVVKSQIHGPVLTYSKRKRLLQLADRLGIRRFDANLIVAAMQYRTQTAPHPNPSTHRCAVTSEGEGEKKNLLLAPLTFLLTQSVIVLTAWFIFS